MEIPPVGHAVLNPKPDTEVIITGTGQGRRVAVLFSHKSFPGARFGHRFPLGLDTYGGDPVYLMEEIETGALHRMMQAQPAADDNGVIWTTWGDPGPDPEGGPAPAAASGSPPT